MSVAAGMLELGRTRKVTGAGRCFLEAVGRAIGLFSCPRCFERAEREHKGQNGAREHAHGLRMVDTHIFVSAMPRTRRARARRAEWRARVCARAPDGGRTKPRRTSPAAAAEIKGRFENVVPP